jgi:hypothetical protein
MPFGNRDVHDWNGLAAKRLAFVGEGQAGTHHVVRPLQDGAVAEDDGRAALGPGAIA